MKSARILLVVVAVAAIASAILLRPKAPLPRSAVSSSLDIHSDGSMRTTSTLQAAAPKVSSDVFFLAEAGSSRTKRGNPSSMRQPNVNGTRRAGPGRAVTSRQEGNFISPKWSPDGLELLFSRPGYNGLFTKGTVDGSLTQVTDRENVGFRSKWSDRGEIETVSNSGEKQSFNPDGTPVDPVTMENDTSRVGTWTKDDTVYYRGAPGEPGVPLTQGDDRYYGGVISPDGKYVVYNGLHTGLYIQPLDSSAPPVSLGEGYSPSWLPDGSGIVYNVSQDDGHYLVGSDLYLASVDGSTISNLTQTPSEIEVNPTVSPDGSQVAYESDGVIYIAPLH